MSSETLKQLKIDAVLRAGETVGGHYRVDHLIAQGGMAAVWAGENLRTGKRVALKVIRGSFAAQSIAAEMFRRESIAASKINHPNVVSVFDVIDHNGMTLIVMELLHGESLAEYLEKKKPLSVREAVMLLLPAMRGVAAAHAHGVIHRDLKPGNIFLCQDTDGSLITTKVLDFGISKVGGRGPTTESDQIDLARFGTPAYMSPEDITGATPVDARVDVYGFGVLLFESVTGQLPFEGPGLELLERILNHPPPKVRSLRPELPAEVEQIIDRALAKDPNERFPNVEHFIQAIEDKVLAPLAVPRALMPIAESSLSFSKGIPTQLLIGESAAARKTTAEARAESQTPLATSTGRVLRTLAGGVRAFKLSDWRIGLAAALLVGTVLGAWLALPSSSGTASSAAPSVPASALPLPAAPVQPPVPPAEPGAPSTPAWTRPMPVPAAPASSGAPASVRSGSEASVAGHVPAASPPATAERNYGPFESEKPTKASRPGRVRKAGGPAPRAGRLTVSDF